MTNRKASSPAQDNRPWPSSWEDPQPPPGDGAGEASSLDQSVEHRLAAARANRAQAERARQCVVDQVLEATQEVCRGLMADGERALEKARQLRDEAEQKHRQAEEELEQARITRAETNSYCVRATIQAQQKAQGLMEEARAIAQREGQELREQATLDSRRMLAEAEMMRAAAQEELEAQRMYTEAARLQAQSHHALAQLRSRMTQPEAVLGDAACGPPPAPEMGEGWRDLVPEQTPQIEEMAQQPASPPAQAEGFPNGHRPARASGPTG